MVSEGFEDFEVFDSIEGLWVAYRATKDMDACPYLRGTGTCVTGCGARPEPEPHCITDCPDREGWGPELHRLELLIASDLQRVGRYANGCRRRRLGGLAFRSYHPDAPQGLSWCSVCHRVVIRGKGRWWR